MTRVSEGSIYDAIKGRKDFFTAGRVVIYGIDSRLSTTEFSSYHNEFYRTGPLEL